MAPRTAAVPPVDLRQVLYFVAVAEELNFSRAAERLHLSAPSLSQQVKALERSLGVQLLVRDTRHVHLTPAGTRFAEASRDLLLAGEAAVADARAAAGLVSGGLVLAALHEAEQAFEPFLTRFHTAYPAIHVSVDTMRHAQLLSALRGRTIDAALTWSFLLERAGDSDGLQWLQVAPTEVLAAMSPESALAGRERVKRGEELRGTRAVLFERAYSPITFDYALEQLYGAGPPPPVHEISVTVRAQEAMAREVLTGDDTLTPLSESVASLLRGSLRLLPFDPPWLMDGCVVWQRDNSSAALGAFLAAAATEVVRPPGGPGADVSR